MLAGRQLENGLTVAARTAFFHGNDVPAQEAAAAALTDDKFLAETLATNIESLAMLKNCFDKLNIKYQWFFKCYKCD